MENFSIRDWRTWFINPVFLKAQGALRCKPNTLGLVMKVWAMHVFLHALCKAHLLKHCINHIKVALALQSSYSFISTYLNFRRIHVSWMFFICILVGFEFYGIAALHIYLRKQLALIQWGNLKSQSKEGLEKNPNWIVILSIPFFFCYYYFFLNKEPNFSLRKRKEYKDSQVYKT